MQTNPQSTVAVVRILLAHGITLASRNGVISAMDISYDARGKMVTTWEEIEGWNTYKALAWLGY